jgi:hypothetical protein
MRRGQTRRRQWGEEFCFGFWVCRSRSSFCFGFSSVDPRASAYRPRLPTLTLTEPPMRTQLSEPSTRTNPAPYSEHDFTARFFGAGVSCPGWSRGPDSRLLAGCAAATDADKTKPHIATVMLRIRLVPFTLGSPRGAPRRRVRYLEGNGFPSLWPALYPGSTGKKCDHALRGRSC